MRQMRMMHQARAGSWLNDRPPEMTAVDVNLQAVQRV